jgi:heme/copper-type cytochrome/quinol oxidase subunit 2
MFAFVLGTSPVFFVLGYFATKLADVFQKSFMKLAAVALILLAVFNMNTAIALSGSNLTLGNIAKGFWCVFAICGVPHSYGQAVNEAKITIGQVAYIPNAITVRAGSQVTLHLHNKEGASCIQAFTIPQLGIQRVVPLGSSADITFTAPQNPGQIAFMCSMGMFRGVITVI